MLVCDIVATRPADIVGRRYGTEQVMQGRSVRRQPPIRRRWTLVAAAAAMLVLAGCTSSPKPSTALEPASPAPSSSATGNSGNNGTVNWTQCDDVATQILNQPVRGYQFDCGSITVPADWKHPGDGKTFRIALIRVRNDNQTNRIGSLLVNPGGPGGSGVELAVQLTQEIPNAISHRFDLVGFDPRGVGRSTEVQCIGSAAQDKLYAAPPDPASAQAFNSIVALTKQTEAACGTKYGDQLPLFSTEQAARDMDAIRQAVGDQKMTYLGYSYGTLLGAVYAQLFPTKVRAMVLDGAIDPAQSSIARSEAQAAGFELAYRDFVNWCHANPSQCPIASNPRGAINTALANAAKSPRTYTDGRKVTDGWVYYGIIQAMYSQSLWGALAQGVAQLGQGNPRIIMALADSYTERSPNGQYSNLLDANLAVNCADFASEPTVAQIRVLQAQWRTKYPMFGASTALGLLSCAQGEWPGKPDAYPTGPATGAPPILVVGTTNDPATPYAGTAKLAGMLGVGEVLTWQGEGHTAYPQTPCITTAVDNYLIDLKPPPKNTVCPKQ
jgi:pimeloyl-ACP methyl ester carboxylesterase